MKIPTNFVASKAIVILLVSLTLLLTYIWYVGEKVPVKKNGKVYILCFGDSITKGNTGKGFNHPYSLALAKHLNNKHHKKDYQGKFVVHTSGINGERAHVSMESRLPTLLKTRKYDWVIILGGTNDLRMFESDNPETKYNEKHYGPILKALKKLHRTVHKYGGKTVLVTIPGRRCEKMDYCKHLKAVRFKLNERLRRFAAKFKNKVVLADLDRSMTINKFEKFWSDEVHFTPDGYDKIGHFIYNSISSSL